MTSERCSGHPTKGCCYHKYPDPDCRHDSDPKKVYRCCRCSEGPKPDTSDRMPGVD